MCVTCTNIVKYLYLTAWNFKDFQTWIFSGHVNSWITIIAKKRSFSKFVLVKMGGFVWNQWKINVTQIIMIVQKQVDKRSPVFTLHLITESEFHRLSYPQKNVPLFVVIVCYCLDLKSYGFVHKIHQGLILFRTAIKEQLSPRKQSKFRKLLLAEWRSSLSFFTGNCIRWC